VGLGRWLSLAPIERIPRDSGDPGRLADVGRGRLAGQVRCRANDGCSPLPLCGAARRLREQPCTPWPAAPHPRRRAEPRRRPGAGVADLPAQRRRPRSSANPCPSDRPPARTRRGRAPAKPTGPAPPSPGDDFSDLL